MKLLFFTTVYPDEFGSMGGIFIHNQAVALQKAGHDIAVLFVDFRSIRRKRPFGFSVYEIDGIQVYRYAFPCGPIFSLIDALGTVLTEKIYERVNRVFGKPDLIYAHFGGSAKFVLKTVETQKIPLVVIEHDSGMLTGSIAKTKLEERSNTYNKADSVIAVSSALKDRIQKYTMNKVEVIPNIIPDYMFENRDSFKKANLSDFLFISVGNLIKSKSFDQTIIAFASVVKEFKHIKLFIVGEGPEENKLRRLVSEYGLEEKVEFKGRMSNRELSVLLKNCDCFVLPSKFETFGVVYIEAMANGLPVIAASCGGPEEFINEKNGILVPVGDIVALDKAMQCMVKDIKFNHKYDNKSIRNFAYKLSSEFSVVQKLENLFSNVVDK